MAEALFRRHGGSDFEVESAGAQPRPIDPLSITTLAEIGIDAHGVQSKAYEVFTGQHFDYVIALSDRGRERCPNFEGSYVSLHWASPDPSDFDSKSSLDLSRSDRRVTSCLRDCDHLSKLHCALPGERNVQSRVTLAIQAPRLLFFHRTVLVGIELRRLRAHPLTLPKGPHCP